MIEFIPYPMALYDPVTKELHIVKDEKEHEAVLTEWADVLQEENEENERLNVVPMEKRKPGRPKKA